MTFIWPWMLLTLLLIPLFVGIYFRLLKKRQQAAGVLGPMGVVQGSSGRNLGRRRHIPPLLFLIGLVLLLTILLAILAFGFSLIGTFIVRSGVLVSVHAFATDPARGVFILIFLCLVVGGSLALFAVGLIPRVLSPGLPTAQEAIRSQPEIRSGCSGVKCR